MLFKGRNKWDKTNRKEKYKYHIKFFKSNKKRCSCGRRITHHHLLCDICHRRKYGI